MNSTSPLSHSEEKDPLELTCLNEMDFLSASLFPPFSIAKALHADSPLFRKKWMIPSLSRQSCLFLLLSPDRPFYFYKEAPFFLLFFFYGEWVVR